MPRAARPNRKQLAHERSRERRVRDLRTVARASRTRNGAIRPGEDSKWACAYRSMTPFGPRGCAERRSGSDRALSARLGSARAASSPWAPMPISAVRRRQHFRRPHPCRADPAARRHRVVFLNGRPIRSEGKQSGISPAGRCGERHSRKWSVGDSPSDGFEPFIAARHLACQFAAKCPARIEGAGPT
jgi:hypothetical protein